MEINYDRVQTLTNMEKALKENYLPVWRNGLTTEPSPLLGKIKKKKLTSNKIVTSAPIGLSGGFGYGAEGYATPQAGPVPFERFETYAKDKLPVVFAMKHTNFERIGDTYVLWVDMQDALSSKQKLMSFLNN